MREGEVVGIYRRCRRCAEWLPLKRYVDLGVVCMDCCNQKTTVYIAHSRAIVLTPKGRAYIAA